MLKTDDDKYYSTDEVVEMFKLQDEFQRKFIRKYCLEYFEQEQEGEIGDSIIRIQTPETVVYLWSQNDISRLIESLQKDCYWPHKNLMQDTYNCWNEDDNYQALIDEWHGGYDVAKARGWGQKSA